MNTGYRWRIEPQGEDWSWALVEHDTDEAVIAGKAPSRRVAAAMLVRAISTGITTPGTFARLAA